MVRSLRERLSDLDCKPEIVKCALVPEDITRYNLPPDFTKSTDTRSESFVAKYGDVAVELDALPVDVLRQRLIDEVVARMDMKALARTRRKEKREIKKLTTLLVGSGVSHVFFEMVCGTRK